MKNKERLKKKIIERKKVFSVFLLHEVKVILKNIPYKMIKIHLKIYRSYNPNPCPPHPQSLNIFWKHKLLIIIFVYGRLTPSTIKIISCLIFSFSLCQDMNMSASMLFNSHFKIFAFWTFPTELGFQSGNRCMFWKTTIKWKVTDD